MLTLLGNTDRRLLKDLSDFTITFHTIKPHNEQYFSRFQKKCLKRSTFWMMFEQNQSTCRYHCAIHLLTSSICIRIMNFRFQNILPGATIREVEVPECDTLDQIYDFLKISNQYTDCVRNLYYNKIRIFNLNPACQWIYL